MNKTIKTLSLIIACMAPNAGGQSTPIPAELETNFAVYGPVASVMTLPAPATGSIVGSFTFRNRESKKGVNVAWQIQLAGVTLDTRMNFYDTGYQPTALSKRAGLGTKIYVTGWIPRLNQVIVEEWDFAPYAFAETTSPQGEPIVTLSDMHPNRTTLLLCSTIQPLSSIECNYYANELWLLEAEVASPKKAYSFDLTSGSECSDLVELHPNTGPVNVNSYPQLQDLTTFSAREHPDDGFYIYLETRRPWESGWEVYEPYYLLVFSDHDKDGVMDVVTTPTYHDFYEDRPLSEWTWEYQ